MRDYWAAIPSNIISLNLFFAIVASPMVLLAIILLVLFVEQMARFRTEDAIRRIGASLLAIIYLGLGGAFILAIRRDCGVPMLVLFLVSVKFTDIGAYFTGSAIGKHKMIPWLSPGKSWEGLVGGVAVSILASIAICKWLDIRTMATWQVVMFAVVVALAGQFGDLCESLLKRSAKQKDSGAALPEFGGVLDVIDSPLLAAPLAYLVLAILQA
jgi:phosphatidate cytidylyltransferase